MPSKSMARPDPSEFKALLDSAHSVAILLPKNPSYDLVAAALALKLSLEGSAKNPIVSCPDPMTVEFHRLVGADTVTSNFGSRNLVITFPGQTELVDKISYNVENGELQLVVTPKINTPGIDYRRLKFVSAGAQADLVILVGVHDLTDMGQIYLDAKEFLKSVRQYSISDLPASEAVTHLIGGAQLPLDADAASNLLSGLQKATNYFQDSTVSADTFEAAALLLRRGARRHEVYAPAQVPPGGIPQPTSPAASSSPTPVVTADDVTNPPSDWYEPKVYRGTSLS